MSLKKIKKLNGQKFIDDLRMVSDVMIIAHRSNAFLHVSKKELLKEAEDNKIQYYITKKLFVVERDAMVII